MHNTPVKAPPALFFCNKTRLSFAALSNQQVYHYLWPQRTLKWNYSTIPISLEVVAL